MLLEKKPSCAKQKARHRIRCLPRERKAFACRAGAAQYSTSTVPTRYADSMISCTTKMVKATATRAEPITMKVSVCIDRIYLWPAISNMSRARLHRHTDVKHREIIFIRNVQLCIRYESFVGR